MTTPPQIPGFRIERAAGSGNHATVWSAIQESLARRVALKVFHRDLGLDTEPLFREARLAGSIQSPHIVHVHDCGQHGDWCYIAQEWIEGADAQRLLEQHAGRLPVPEALRIIHAAALGAAAIADAGLVHRDIKPSNIMVTTRGDVKLTDLGTALHQIGGRTVSATGVVMGTPAFMAPEQARGETVIDVRCDVYALGATLFTLLTGTSFVGGDSAVAVMTRVATTPAPDLRERAPWLPTEIAEVIRACTAFDRRHRLAHPALVAEDCAALLRDAPPVHARAVLAKPRLRLQRLAAVWLLPLTFAALIAGGVWGWLESRQQQRVPAALSAARAHPTLAAWEAIHSQATGDRRLEAERMLALLREIELVRVAPAIPAPDTRELDALRAEQTALDATIANARADIATAQTAATAAEASAQAVLRASAHVPVLPETVDVDFIARRLTTATLPESTLIRSVVDLGDAVGLLRDDALSLSSDGGHQWDNLPSTKRFSQVMGFGDVIVATGFDSSAHILQNRQWQAIPWHDDHVPDYFGRERSGRWLALRREGNRRPGVGIVWTSTDTGRTWTELTREEQVMAVLPHPDGLVITAWRGRPGGTWALYPGTDAFVPIADEGKGWAWQHLFVIDEALLFLPPNHSHLLHRTRTGEHSLRPCGLPKKCDVLDLVILDNPSRWYAWTRPQGILRSLDEGRTWHASVGPLEKLGQSLGTIVRWGPQRDLLLFALRDSAVAPVVLDDRDGHPAVFPAKVLPQP